MFSMLNLSEKATFLMFLIELGAIIEVQENFDAAKDKVV